MEYIGPAPGTSQLFEFIYAPNPGGDWVLPNFVGMHDNQGAKLFVDPSNVLTQKVEPTTLISQSASDWTTADEGRTSNDVYASTNVNGAEVVYQYPDFGIPPDATIVHVVLGVEYYTAENESFDVEISWDGGGTWTGTQAPIQIISTDAVNCTAAECFIITGASGEYAQWIVITDENTWTPAQFNSGTVQARITYNRNGGGTGGINYLDSVPLLVTYNDPTPERAITFNTVPQSVPPATPSQVVTFEVRDSTQTLTSGTATISADNAACGSCTVEFSLTGGAPWVNPLTNVSYDNVTGASFFFREGTASSSAPKTPVIQVQDTFTPSIGTQVAAINAPGTNEGLGNNRAFIFQVDVSPATVPVGLPTTGLKLRYWVMDQDGLPVTVLVAADFPAGSVTLTNATRAVADPSFTLGGTVTHLGNGLYEQDLTITAGDLQDGDRLIAKVQMHDTVATEWVTGTGLYLESSASFNYGSGLDTELRHIAVQPDQSSLLQDPDVLSPTTFRVRLYDRLGNRINDGGAGSFSVLSWWSSDESDYVGDGSIGTVTPVWSGTDLEYTVTVTVDTPKDGINHYVTMAYTDPSGNQHEFSFSQSVFKDTDPGDVIANPMFYNDPVLDPTN